MAKPSQIIASNFPFEPTTGQKQFFRLLDNFLLTSPEQARTTFMLKGYAGTGKTTLVSSLVQTLPYFKYKFVLLAPTGRAAKVMANYAHRKAFTVHKCIYRRAADPIAGKLQFKRQQNYHTHTVFIVDEASMLANDPGLGRNGLLADLIDYVFEHASNKLMLVGDNAQLPPVKQIFSHGLDADYLSNHFGLTITETELTEVTRQSLESGILYNATLLRNQLNEQPFKIQFQTKQFPDFYRMSGEKLEEGLRYAYHKYGTENTIVICRSNKMAVQYNQYIRRSILFYDNEIEAGDYLMIVRNNYFFLPEDSPAGFLANGDFVEVMKIKNFEEVHGFRFATLVFRLVDYPEQDEFKAKVVLNTLYSPSPALTEEESNQLFESVMDEYKEVVTKKERHEAIRNDLYLNALQVKFAYALTCHKSQGGQWDAVFVDQGFLQPDMLNHEFIRWTYTAITRAKSELFLMNFNEIFF